MSSSESRVPSSKMAPSTGSFDSKPGTRNSELGTQNLEPGTRNSVVPPFTPEQEKILAQWTRYYPYPIMGIIPALREVQKWHLCVRPEDEEHLAALFETTRGRVHELVTFFPFFTQKPTGRHRIGLCRGLSCAMAGSRDMAEVLSKKLGVAEKVTTSDGKFSFETMECLGACDFAPAAIINERLKGQATEESISEWIEGAHD